MQAVIGTQSGDTHQFELDDAQAQALTGRQIGDEIDGDAIGLGGYTLRITGGTDQDGFPMRDNVQGTGRKKILLTKETGGKRLREGERRRKSVRGNTVAQDIEQLNLAVVDEGSASIEELLGGDDEEDEADEE